MDPDDLCRTCQCDPLRKMQAHIFQNLYQKILFRIFFGRKPAFFVNVIKEGAQDRLCHEAVCAIGPMREQPLRK